MTVTVRTIGEQPTEEQKAKPTVTVRSIGEATPEAKKEEPKKEEKKEPVKLDLGSFDNIHQAVQATEQKTGIQVRKLQPSSSKVQGPGETPLIEPEYFDSLKNEIVDLFTKPGETSKELTVDSAAVPFGGAEVVANLTGQLFGAFIGMLRAGVESGISAVEFEPPKSWGEFLRPLPGVSLNVKKFYSSIAENLPDLVQGEMLRYTYTPKTETGKMLLGQVEEVFHGVAKLGEDAAETTFEKMSQSDNPKVRAAAPAVATGVRIMPEAILMFGGMRLSNNAVRNKVTEVAERHVERQIKQEEYNVFDTEVLAEFPRLTDVELVRKGELLKEKQQLHEIPVELRTPEVNTRLKEVDLELDAIRVKEFRSTTQEIKTSMPPEEVLAVASKTQKLKLKGEHFIEIGTKEGKGRPVLLEREAGELKITEGLEEAYTAYLLGHKSVPVRIKENIIDPKALAELADKSHAYRQAVRDRAAALEKALKRPASQAFMEAFFDRQYGMKKRLIEVAGDLGKKVVRQFELLAGATSHAKLFQRWFLDDIFSKVSDRHIALDFTTKSGKRVKYTEEQILDEIVSARRNIAVLERHPQHKIEGGKTIQGERALLEDLAQRLGPREYKRYHDLSEKYFDSHRELLDLRYREGLIDRELYEKILDNNYSPIRILEILDQEVQGITMKGQPITVTSSGVPLLKSGSGAPIKMSAKELLQENTMRTWQAVFRNRANKKLAEIATKFPKNPIVRHTTKKKQPRGEKVIIEYFDKGKKKRLMLDERFAKSWVNTNPELTNRYAFYLRWAMGTPVVKATAVGFNPSFFLVDFPRNILHMWIAGRRTFVGQEQLYSAALPKYLAEVTVDMASIMRDAATKKGFFEALSERGAFPQFLAHVGRSEMYDPTSIFSLKNIDYTKGGAMTRSFDRTLRAMSWLNEYSEILMRMSIAERTLKVMARDQIWREAGKKVDETGRAQTIPDKLIKERMEQLRRDPEALDAAAHEARRVIDYAQAGSATRLFDLMSPFLNPAMQAFRTSFRGMKEDPAAAAAIHMQIAGAVGFLYFYNWMTNPEAAATITDDDAVSGFNFVLSPIFNMVDEHGNFQYPYLHIPSENVFMVTAGLTYFALRKRFEGREPSSRALKILKHASVITPAGLIPPTIDAMVKLGTGVDFWRDGDLWTRDKNVAQYEQYYKEHEKNMTPRMYVELGRMIHELTTEPGTPESEGLLTKLSNPTRLKGIVDSYFADHMINRIWNEHIEEMFAGTPQYHRYRTTAEMLKKQPFIARILRIGTTKAPAFEDLKGVQTQTPTLHEQNNAKIDAMLERYNAGELTLEPMTQFVASKALENPVEAQRMDRRIKTSVDAIEAIRTIKDRRGMPDIEWWKSAADRVSPEDRAEAAYNWWIRLEPDRRRAFENMMHRVPSFVDKNQRFYSKFRQLQQERGVERRGADIYGEIDFWEGYFNE